ncbi:hypothetical protein H5410_043655 [Solanum commersonii]|uniref:Uncharacterized protein n=1 Tax=Solanum commersonii TaxID=4109 RepID=A0A9J5XZ09_SOLCO|nr:hypothetical protein H5410_043655 [Solanum commersonii]
MSSNINHKNVHAFQKSNRDRNARRRELYKLMPLEKKEILLASCRAKRAEMRKHNLSESSMNNNLATTPSSNSTMVSVAQNSDLMRELMLLLSEIDSTMPLETNYIKLKEVSNCHFCKVIRFEYEPPAFCCSNGSVQLTSHEIPTKLKNLYLENTELSKHFRTYIRTYNNIFAFTSLGVTYNKELAKNNNDVPQLSDFYIALKCDSGLDQRIYNLPTCRSS